MTAYGSNGGGPGLQMAMFQAGITPEALLLDAASAIGDQGTGLAETILSDVAGQCGRDLQTLLVAPR